MELKQLVAIQKEFDQRHGWMPPAEDSELLVSFIVRDLVGLFGEVGEFANLVKKVQLCTGIETEQELRDQLPFLKEELIDSFIYLMRFATYLNIDLEAEYFRKLSLNEKRFQRFLIPESEQTTHDHESS